MLHLIHYLDIYPFSFMNLRNQFFVYILFSVISDIKYEVTSTTIMLSNDTSNNGTGLLWITGCITANRKRYIGK